MISKIYTSVCQKIGAAKIAPTAAQKKAVMLAASVATLFVGMEGTAHAQGVLGSIFAGEERSQIVYDDARIQDAIRVIFEMLEGSFGALIAVGAGILAVLSSAFGQYRAALGCLIVAVGSFILRSFVFTWFDVQDLGTM